MMRLRRTWICFLALSILPLDIPIAPPAAAQNYPNQTVKIVVPFPPAAASTWSPA